MSCVEKGSLRFIRRYYENVLLVAVYSGEWKLVCDLPLNSLGADIICRSAGFRRAESFHLPLFEIYYSYYGHILSNVNAVNDVNCFGNETSLLDCSYREHTGCYVGSIVTCEEGIQFVNFILNINSEYLKNNFCTAINLNKCRITQLLRYILYFVSIPVFPGIGFVESLVTVLNFDIFPWSIIWQIYVALI